MIKNKRGSKQFMRFLVIFIIFVLIAGFLMLILLKFKDVNVYFIGKDFFSKIIQTTK